MLNRRKEAGKGFKVRLVMPFCPRKHSNEAAEVAHVTQAD